MTSAPLAFAIDAYAHDDVGTARNLLQDYVAHYPDDEKGWYWMSRVAEQPLEKRACLQRMFRLRSSRRV